MVRGPTLGLLKERSPQAADGRAGAAVLQPYGSSEGVLKLRNATGRDRGPHPLFLHALVWFLISFFYISI